jgi:hypothetical protein
MQMALRHGCIVRNRRAVSSRGRKISSFGEGGLS